MAKDTKKDLRNQMIYSVYVRNYSEAGTFAQVEADLDRIRALGTDIIWFLPIHPIGKKNKLGELGCPYSIADYRAVNPEYGTFDDFTQLVNAIHAKGMLCMIDVVYNHTSWDSVLLKEHPEYFYRTPSNTLGNRAGVWDDVVDLDYSNPELWEYQIETLKFWVENGVDGFRCDVASVVPVDFWVAARTAVAKINPNVLWLAESVHAEFVRNMRTNGFYCASDSELYEAFDLTYDYDIWHLFDGYFDKKNDLQQYLQAVVSQESTYPANYIKMRCLENHDQRRAKSFLPDEHTLSLWTAWFYFLKGTALLYNGQEAQATNTPSLFEHDPIVWSLESPDYSSLLHTLSKLKKTDIVRDGRYNLTLPENTNGCCIICYKLKNRTLIGIFNLGQNTNPIPLSLPDGVYRNILNEESVQVSAGIMPAPTKAVIIDYLI